jgi:hypothetical protein
MALGPIVPYLLAELDLLQLPDHPRSQRKRDEKGGDRGIDDPEALVPKDVEKRKLCV